MASVGGIPVHPWFPLRVNRGDAQCFGTFAMASGSTQPVNGKGVLDMSDKLRTIGQNRQDVEEGRKKGSMPPEVQRGDEVYVDGRRAFIYAILYDGGSTPGQDGYQIGVVFLEDKQGLANFAKWSGSDRCWEFLEGEIPREARPALDGLVQKLRFSLVK